MIIQRIYKRLRNWEKKRRIWSKYGNLTRFHFEGERYDIGDNTYGVPTVHSYDLHTKLKIGKYCSLAAGIQIVLGGNHHVKWVSTYAFYQEVPTFPNWLKIGENSTYRGDVKIGNDVWIGRNALILSGAEIGDGAVIGAGAVVAGKIPPYSIAVGNPAKVIRKRFDDDVIDKLLKIKWWDWPTNRINQYLTLICSENVDEFIKEVELI